MPRNARSPPLPSPQAGRLRWGLLALLHNPPVLQMELPGAAVGEGGVVGDQHEAGAVALMLGEEAVDDEAAGRAVKIAGRLVGEDQGRAGGEGAGDRDALLLAARQFARVVAGAVAEPDPAERRRGLGEGVAAAVELERDRDVLERGHRRQQVEALEDYADPGAAQAGETVFVEGGEVLAGQRDPAGALGCSRPAITIISVDLPEPDGPISATVSPAASVSDTPRRISTGPAAPVRLRRTSSSAIRGVVVIGSGYGSACVPPASFL